MFAAPFCYLTTRGRRTGRDHTIEIWFAAASAEGPLYLMAGGREQADWVRNLQADPAVSVRIDDVVHGATGRVVEAGTDEDALARRLLLEKYQRDGNLAGWGQSALPVAIDLA